MKVLFAPDYTEGNSYQRLLAESLRELGVEVNFASHYRRGLPLYRLCKDSPCDLLHLHWPEAYFRVEGSPMDPLRALRYPVDFKMAQSLQPIIVTGHNLYPHQFKHRHLHRRNMEWTYREADGVIVHSRTSEQKLMCETHRLHHLRMPDIIRHGFDHSILTSLPSKESCRRALSLDSEPLVILMFGAISPYKGIMEAADTWLRQQPELQAQLYIVGKPRPEAYGESLIAQFGNEPSITIIGQHLPEKDLLKWIKAADACLFHYKEIFTSGSAILARGIGTPILFPERCNTVDLQEPSSHVIRYSQLNDSFFMQLNDLPDGPPEDLDTFIENHCWNKIAKDTLSVYKSLLETR